MDYLDKENIVAAFRKCGMQPGAVLMLHSDAIFLAQTQLMHIEERYALFFDALDEVLGPEGTLVIPTFTYSATKGEPFVVEETPSIVGELTEYFRKLPGVLRSRDPIFSVAVRGDKAQEFSNVEVEDSFGANSVFDLLNRYDAWLGCLAGKFLMTYTHFVEQAVNVDYRYFKEFEYTIIENGVSQEGSLRFFVRDLERESDMDLSHLKRVLTKKKLLHTVTMGRFYAYMVKCRDFRKNAEVLIAKYKNALIKEGVLVR
jgi:aminoglycoside 3-N-acetyltransferase